MNMLSLILIPVLVLLVSGTVLALVLNRRAERRQKAARIIAGQSSGKSGKAGNSRDQRRADVAKKLKESGEEDGKKAKKNTTRDMIRAAGLDLPVHKFWIYAVALTVMVIFALKVLLGMSTMVVALIGITTLFGLPRLILKMMAKHRQKKFLDDFSDALEAMVRLLKAGMPVGEAIAMIAREFSGPVGEEMSKIYDTQRIGVPLAQAVLEAAERMPLTEMQMFATGIAIQQQTGSSLSDILQNLANVIRARYRLKRKVAALAAEAKASAAIIGALPPLVAGGLYAINPEYMGVMFTTSTGKMYLTGASAWMAIGILVMRQMINFKV